MRGECLEREGRLAKVRESGMVGVLEVDGTDGLQVDRPLVMNTLAYAFSQQTQEKNRVESLPVSFH
jgi:hypothetical protein